MLFNNSLPSFSDSRDTASGGRQADALAVIEQAEHARHVASYNRARCRAICARTWAGAVPPNRLRALSEPRRLKHA